MSLFGYKLLLVYHVVWISGTSAGSMTFLSVSPIEKKGGIKSFCDYVRSLDGYTKESVVIVTNWKFMGVEWQKDGAK